MKKLIVFGNAECEYWAREFGAEVYPKTHEYIEAAKKLISNGIKPIIQVGSIEELDELLFFPKGSLSIHLYADETYSPILNRKLFGIESASIIIRSYPVNSFSLRSILKSQLSGLVDFFNNINPRNFILFIKMSFAGMIMAIRQRRISKLESLSSKTTILLPLGYTNLFCQSYIEYMDKNYSVKISDNESLIKSRTENLIRICSDSKKFDFGFVGQTGSLARQFAVNAIRDYGNMLILREKFGGTLGGNEATIESGAEYVEVLMKSKYSICPPGNFSGNSFRIVESLICGSFPIVSSHVLTDPLYRDPINLNAKSRWIHSWEQRIETISNMTQNEIEKLSNKATLKLVGQIEFSRLKMIGEL